VREMTGIHLHRRVDVFVRELSRLAWRRCICPFMVVELERTSGCIRDRDWARTGISLLPVDRVALTA